MPNEGYKHASQFTAYAQTKKKSSPLDQKSVLVIYEKPIVAIEGTWSLKYDRPNQNNLFRTVLGLLCMGIK